MSWSSRRKYGYLGAVFIIIAIAITVPAYQFFYTAPTCSDGIQNQDEGGVDCGGRCIKVCAADALSPLVKWNRVFKVTDGYYNAIAFVENPNLDAGARKVRYIFRVYDSKSVLIADRRGTIDILPNHSLPIFEPNIATGQKIPNRATFEFTSVFEWERENVEYPSVSVTNKTLSREESTPRLDATIQNNTLTRIKNLPVVAILYDLDGNAVAASRTVIDALDKGAKETVAFTWPQPFGKQVSERGVYPMVGFAD